MTALYRKYRPQRFEDVVGQATVVRTLRNAIAHDRVAHAYLFTGSKGTGKTTMAKLLAKALNCEQGPTTDPCGVCESCVAIAEGRSMDVAEIDAASNRGIDDVREKIIDTVAFQPSSGTRRVYILDEAHQLTSQAFNALLKTIEEPPDHVLFAFCTTETHQMMATVRDRCQRLALAPPNAEDLFGVLRRVADTEQIEADDQALRAIARVAQGSFRNALGLLEMLATAFDRSFTHSDVLSHLGAFSEDLLFDVADSVLSADAAAVLQTIEQLVQDGSDPEQFARELAEHLRVLLLAGHGVQSIASTVTDMPRMRQQAQDADERKVLAAIDCLNDAIGRIRVGGEPRLAVEAALVRACQGLGLPSLALRLAVLEQQALGSYGKPLPAGAGGAVPPSAQATPPTPTSAPAPAPAPAAAKPPQAPAPAAAPAARSTAQVAAPAGTSGPVPVQDVEAWWPQVLAAVPASQRPVLQQARVLGVHDGRLRLESAIPITDKLRGMLNDQLRQIIGVPLGIDVRPVTGGAGAHVAPVAPAQASSHAAADDEVDWQDATEPTDDNETAAPPPAAGADAGAAAGQGLADFQAAFDATELSR